ncbi:hypothetical protein F3Y22_tig00110469pilonHSYRG00239 [Hibiscus syriacus]|uniref:Uncharacterized protein n=1 Tax=Hibiscus syriacus TaxID=106335 RepID=A0A6A3AG04_HIBSY|nr:hypothetical protein F3Y22_tig00110469pilonHSYRG00239 [Hibiscus syriacus]
MDNNEDLELISPFDETSSTSQERKFKRLEKVKTISENTSPIEALDFGTSEPHVVEELKSGSLYEGSFDEENELSSGFDVLGVERNRSDSVAKWALDFDSMTEEVDGNVEGQSQEKRIRYFKPEKTYFAIDDHDGNSSKDMAGTAFEDVAEDERGDEREFMEVESEETIVKHGISDTLCSDEIKSTKNSHENLSPQVVENIFWVGSIISSVSDFVSGAFKIVYRQLKHDDSTPSVNKPRNDYLVAQVNTLRQELQILASNRPITIVTGRGTCYDCFHSNKLLA